MHEKRGYYEFYSGEGERWWLEGALFRDPVDFIIIVAATDPLSPGPAQEAQALAPAVSHGDTRGGGRCPAPRQRPLQRRVVVVHAVGAGSKRGAPPRRSVEPQGRIA